MVSRPCPISRVSIAYPRRMVMNTGLNRTKWEPYVWLLPSILLIA